MSDGLLPTTGPLGHHKDYQVTNQDLLDNAYKQNAAINKVDSKIQTLSVTVAVHARVIDKLDQIKTIIIWLLSFVGIGGFLSALNWIKLWLHNS